MLPSVINGLVLSILQLATYLIWFDRKNIFNHYFIGFSIIGFIIPSFVFELENFADREIINLYFNINLFGTIFYLIGIFLGSKIKQIIIIDSVMKFSLPLEAFKKSGFKSTFQKLIKFIFLASLAIMILCFLYMGFVPLLAENPYMAKQFKGIYQVKYRHVAFFYRTAKQYVELLMPFLIFSLYTRKRLFDLLLIITTLILIFMTMNRGSMFTGILLSLSIIITLKGNKKVFATYISALIVIFAIGSSLWAILAFLFPNSPFSSWTDGQTIAESIAYGAPDIPDQITLLDAFVNQHNQYTYGLTFIGGLIPFNFPYNPSAWSLRILNDTNDISEIASGGLRIPVTMWGYFSFGWFGVGIIPFISGFLTGYIIKKIKKIINTLSANLDGYSTFYFVVIIYLNIGVIFTEFYKLSIYYFPAFIFYILVILIYKRISGKTIQNKIIQ